MKARSILFVLIILIAGLMPLMAQNSPAGALATGNVINRDVDTYMMVNFAPFVSYDNFFTFMQGSMSSFASPGFSAGYATKLRGNLLHFYLNTSGLSLDNTTGTIDGVQKGETLDKSKSLNLQFDTAFGNLDLGVFKLGLNFASVGKDETYSETSPVDSTRKNTNHGTFTTSLEYGKDFVHDDFSMLLAGGRVSLRLPWGGARTIEEQTTGGTTTKTTTIPNGITDCTRLEIAPQFWYFFKPKIEPRVVISHIYMINTFVLQFYPEETKTIDWPGSPNGYTRRARSYVGDTLFGYYNRQYTMTPRLSIAWRINYSVGFYYYNQGYTSEVTSAGGAENETRKRESELYLTANIMPRLAFAYQLIPATLTLNGAIVVNRIEPINAFGWQFYRNKAADKDADITTIGTRNIFGSINPTFNLGAAWNLSPYLIVESGLSITTSQANNHLGEVSIGVVYKR